MDRWILLKHETIKNKILDFHYDFLLEDVHHCLTWKLLVIPKIDGPSVEIFEHSNHRLIWLTRESEFLTNNRGYVRKVDNGTFKLIDADLNKDVFSVLLKGKIINGLFKKSGSSCQLLSLK
tara:strand:+ start:214 stop:576 length:363 start_codon:yes stop_codon:yes gene_type:complete